MVFSVETGLIFMGNSFMEFILWKVFNYWSNIKKSNTITGIGF
jgi:hypothetical protein